MADFEAVYDLSSLAPEDGTTIGGTGPGIGVSVSAAGDVNGDGFDDMIIGVPGETANGRDYSGTAFVVFGREGGLGAAFDLDAFTATDGLRIDGPTESFGLGANVAAAGDINHDGFDDVVATCSRSLETFVVFGSEDAGGSLDPDTINGDNGFLILGEVSGTAAVGDVDGDGFDDLLLGSRFDYLTDGGYGFYSYRGAAYVLFGDDDIHPTVRLDDPDPGESIKLEGDGDDELGVSVSAAGDLNGDGHADLMVSGKLTGDRPGTTYVVYGTDAGFNPPLDPDALDGSNGFRIVGEGNGGSGASLAALGDLDGDGFDDIAISDPYAGPVDSYGYSAGRTYVVFGRSGGFGVKLRLDTLNGRNGFAIEGLISETYSGYSVAGAGDVNGDGFDDLMILTNNYNGPSAAYVVFGKADGFGTAIDLAALDGSDGFKIQSASAYGPLTATGAGDVNGDGFDDIVIGDVFLGGYYGAGGAYVIYGQAPTSAVTRVGSAADQTILGGAFDDQLRGVRGDDSLMGGDGIDALLGGGGADLLDGGGKDDKLEGHIGDDALIGGDGDDRLYGGDGDDSLDGGTGLDWMLGGGGADSLDGGAGGDKLDGGAGDDVLAGGDDGDLLIGGTGRDLLSGDAGGDRFLFRSGESAAAEADADRILDFTRGEDRMNLIRVDADASTGADDRFSFIGTDAFSGAAGELRFEVIGGHAFVQGDTDGDGTADFALWVENVTVVQAGDFYL